MTSWARTVTIGLVIVVAASGVWLVRQGESQAADRGPIKVGVLHSLTGNTAITERTIADATIMAIDELNRKGGVLGRKIEPIVVDGHSDWPTFAKSAERLITTDRVNAIFGGYTSASRRSMVPIIEQHRSLLLYPTFYEGIEDSPNIVYTGATPNQQTIPAIKWFMENRGKKMSLVGSDYIFPRSTAAIIRDQIEYLGGHIVSEDYLPLGSMKVGPILSRLRKLKPDVIVSLLVGDTNVPFFRGLKAAGIDPERTPTLSLVISDVEMKSLNAKELAGNYVGLNYFQDIDTKNNAEFLQRFRQRFGADRVMSDSMECAYVSVYLWAQAVAKAGSAAPSDVLQAIRGQRFEAPEGTVYVDEENLHTWKTARIAQIAEDGKLEVIWTSDAMIHPVPYSVYRTRRQWENLVNRLYLGWGNSWAAPS